MPDRCRGGGNAVSLSVFRLVRAVPGDMALSGSNPESPPYAVNIKQFSRGERRAAHHGPAVIPGGGQNDRQPPVLCGFPRDTVSVSGRGS